MEILDKINSPEDLRKLDYSQLEKLCAEIRSYMIECCSVNPGHLGASLGAVELAVALHYLFNTPKDKIVWDVGHQAYAHKIITGRREAFRNNRKSGGISGFPKMSESPYDSFGAGHTSTSISAALGLATAASLEGEEIKVVAVIGDGAMSGGLAYEGLNNAGTAKSDILVILNDNQISIDSNVGAMHNYLLRLSTSPSYNRIKNKIWHRLGNVRLRRLIQKFMLSTKLAFFKNGSIFEGLGFRYFGVIDGNDLGQLVATLGNLKNIKGPKLLHIRTVKGKGYKPAELNQSVWHAPGKFNALTGERIMSDNTRSRYQDVFGKTITELAERNGKIVAITPAMASGCSLTEMMQRFPDRTFDVGIAEQHAVTFSAGLAAGGLLPYCNIYSTFLQRAFDEIIHDVALQNLKVIFCVDRAGLVGEDGYPRGYGEGVDWHKEFSYIEPGKARLLRDGSDVAILSLGTVGNRAAKAIDKVSESRKVSPMHYDMRFLKPLDFSAVDYACGKVSVIITVEDGTLCGGLYSAVSEYVCRKYPHCRVLPLGIPDVFVEQGSVDEQMSECKYNTVDICNAIEKSYDIF